MFETCLEVLVCLGEVACGVLRKSFPYPSRQPETLQEFLSVETKILWLNCIYPPRGEMFVPMILKLFIMKYIKATKNTTNDIRSTHVPTSTL